METPLFMVVMKQHNGRNVHSRLTVATRGRLAAHVLYETIGEVVLRPLATRRFPTAPSAMWTDELDNIFLGVSVERRPAGVAKAYGLFRMMTHGVDTSDF